MLATRIRPLRIVASLVLLLAVCPLLVHCNPPASTSSNGVRRVPAIFIPPLHDAQEGEVLTVKAGGGEGEQINEFRVVRTTDTVVTVATTQVIGGVVKGTVEYDYPRNGFGVPGGVIREIMADRVEIGGEMFDAWRLRLHSKYETRHIWVTPELPVHGVARIEFLRKGKPAGVPWIVDPERSVFDAEKAAREAEQRALDEAAGVEPVEPADPEDGE